MSFSSLVEAIASTRLPSSLVEMVLDYHLNDHLVKIYYCSILTNFNSQELKLLTKIKRESVEFVESLSDSTMIKSMIIAMLPNRVKGYPGDQLLSEMIKKIALIDKYFIPVFGSMIRYGHFDLAELLLSRKAKGTVYRFAESDFSGVILDEILSSSELGEHRVLEWYLKVNKDSNGVKEISSVVYGINWDQLIPTYIWQRELSRCCYRKDYQGIRLVAELVDLQDLLAQVRSLAGANNFDICDLIREVRPEVYQRIVTERNVWIDNPILEHWQIKVDSKQDLSLSSESVHMGDIKQEPSDNLETKAKRRRQRRKKLKQVNSSTS